MESWWLIPISVMIYFHPSKMNLFLKTRHLLSQRHLQWHWLDCYLSFRPSTVTEVYPYEDFSGVTWNLARISLTWKYEWGTPWFSFRVFRTPIFKIFKRMNMVRTMWSRFTTVGCWPVTDWPNVTWHQILLSHMCTLRREKKPGKTHTIITLWSITITNFLFKILSGTSGGTKILLEGTSRDTTGFTTGIITDNMLVGIINAGSISGWSKRWFGLDWLNRFQLQRI